GQNLDTRNVRQLGTVGRSLIALQPFKLSNTVTPDLPVDAEQVIHDAGWFGQGTLDMWGQLHLSAAVRNDGSSTFWRSNLRSWFPKGSAAWGFFKDRADASITWYNKTSSDVILLAPVNPSSGYPTQAKNAATIRNRGWEASLNLRPVQAPDYGWDVGLQWARNRSLVQKLPAGLQYVVIGDFNRQVAMTGQPIGVYLGTGFMRCGVSKGTDSVAVDAAGTKGVLSTYCGSAPSGALFIGPDGYPVQDPDLRIVQDPNYDWTASVRSSFR